MFSKFGFAVKILIMEDDPREVIAAEKAVREFGLESLLVKEYCDPSNLDNVILGVLSDVFIGSEPQGFGLAWKCQQLGLPVCVVTKVVGHEYAGWKDPILQSIKDAGIPVFISRSERKDWPDAMNKLGELMHARFLSGEDPLSRSYQRYVKNVSK